MTMDLDQFKQAWSEQNRKLDRMLVLNLQALKAAQQDKTKSALGRYEAFRVFELLLGLVIIGGLSAYIGTRLHTPTLAVPALILGAFIIACVVGNVRQLILLTRIDYADPVTVIQKQFVDLKLHLLRITKPLVLTLPLYPVYLTIGFDLLFGVDLLAHGNPVFIWANVAVGLALVYPALWIVRHLSFEYMEHPVIRAFINGTGGKQVAAALEFLGKLDEFEREEQNVTAG